MAYCGQGSLVKLGGGEIDAKVLRCNCWTCSNCFQRRCKRLVAEAIGGKPTAFITLTSRTSDDKTPIAAASELNQAWRTIRKRICRKYKLKRFPCMTVMEGTKAGWPHLHVLARIPWIDQAWLSNAMNELIGSPVVDIRKIDHPGRVANYVSKYVGKAPHQFGTCKRYYKTLDYEQRTADEIKRPLPPGHWYERSKEELHSIARGQEQCGHVIEWLSDERFKCRIKPLHELYAEYKANNVAARHDH